MKIFPLQSGLFALVDEDDFEKLSLYSWSASNTNSKFYIYAYVGENRITMHRFIMGPPPKGMMIDHINGLTLDCRKENLRFCTPTQNCQNAIMKRSNKTGFKGVSKSGTLFRARIRIGDERVTLGYFVTAEEAALAYATAARNNFGEFANAST